MPAFSSLVRIVLSVGLLASLLLPVTGWGQGTRDPIEVVRSDALFETALQGYVNATNGTASLYFDAWSTAVDRFRDQLDKVKDAPSSSVFSAVLEDQISGLVGSIPVVGGTVNTVSNAAIGDAKAREAAAGSTRLGQFLQGVGTKGWEKRASQYLTSTGDERLSPVRERYQQLRKAYVDALKADRDSGSGSASSGGGVTRGDGSPCPTVSPGNGLVRDLAAVAGNGVSDAERELLEYVKEISSTRHGSPTPELVDQLELGLYASFYKAKGAIFVFDASGFPDTEIKSADVPAEVYKRVEKLIWRVDDSPLDPTPPWGRELFDIPVWRVSVKPPEPNAPLQVPQAMHSLLLPDAWSAQERRDWLEANPEFKRLATARGVPNHRFTGPENEAFRDHVLFSRPVPQR